MVLRAAKLNSKKVIVNCDIILSTLNAKNYAYRLTKIPFSSAEGFVHEK